MKYRYLVVRLNYDFYSHGGIVFLLRLIFINVSGKETLCYKEWLDELPERNHISSVILSRLKIYLRNSKFSLFHVPDLTDQGRLRYPVFYGAIQ
jgi:hypothetical protein